MTELVGATPYKVKYKAKDGKEYQETVSLNPLRFVPIPKTENQIYAALQWYVDEIFTMHAPVVILDAIKEGQAWRSIGDVHTTPLPVLRKSS